MHLHLQTAALKLLSSFLVQHRESNKSSKLAFVYTSWWKFDSCLIPNFNTVKCNLMELMTKSTCDPHRVCRIVMPMHQCIRLCKRSLVSSSVLWRTCISASIRGLRSLGLCCVCLGTCTSACFEPALVRLCSQRFSVIHMRLDPLCSLLCYCAF